MKTVGEYGIGILCSGERIDFGASSSKLTLMSILLLRSSILFEDIVSIAHPSLVLNIIPVFSAIYPDFQRITKKGILVLTTKDKARAHCARYDEIQIKNTMSWERIMPFIKEPPISKDCRTDYYKLGTAAIPHVLQRDVHCTNTPKILFTNEPLDLKLDRILGDKCYGRNEPARLKLKWNPGLVIVECFECWVHTEEEFRVFIDMVTDLSKEDIKVIIHCSNPYSRFLKRIHDEANSAVIQYDSNFFLSKKKNLYNEFWSEHYAECLQRHELDQKWNYEQTYEVMAPIASGNLDVFYKDYQRMKCRHWNELKNQKDFVNVLDRRFYDLYNLAIHPSGYKFYTKLGDEGHYYPTIDEFISDAKEWYLTQDSTDPLIITGLLDILYSFNLELRERTRPLESHSYPVSCKNDDIINWLRSEDELEENARNKYLIITRNRYGRKRIFDDINRLRLRYIRKTNIEACTFEQAIHANPDSCVVMAGTPRWLGELAILLNSFRRVVFFTYMGENEEALRNILETYERAKGIKERDEYFLELFKRLNVDKKAIPNWLIEPDKKARVEIIPTQKPAEAQSRIRVDAEGTHIPQKHIKVVFKDMQSGSQATRYYSKESMLPSFDRTSRSRLVKVTHLRKGDVVFGIQADRGLLEIMCTTYGLDSKVDMDAIKEYYSTLISHAATTSVKSFYSSYCTHAVKPKTIEEFRLWLAQYVIGPELAQDIEAIGRAMDNEHIVLNSAYIFDQIERVRSNHQEMGKMIKKHISQIISRRGLTVDSFKDHVFLESLPIYRVVRIEKKT